VALGEIARELKVNPGVVERKPGHTGELMLAEQEEAKAQDEGPRGKQSPHRAARANV